MAVIVSDDDKCGVSELTRDDYGVRVLAILTVWLIMLLLNVVH